MMHRKRKRNRRLLLWAAALTATAAAAVALSLAVGTAWPYVGPVLVLTIGHRWMYQPGAVPVLTFHSVSEDQAWLPWAPHIAMKPATFARQMAVLRRLRCTVIPTTEFVRARSRGEALPPRPVVIHFDDGYLDNWVAALPVLQRFWFPATLFVSVDFIAPGLELRPTTAEVARGERDDDDLRWRGYLNWAELKAMQACGLIDVQAHGTDHGRLPAGPGCVGKVTAENWRNLSWLQWAATPGDKSGWHEHENPPAIPVGADVPESAPSLTARAWLGDRHETQQEYEARALADLERAKRELEAGLGKEISIFCWPQNVANDGARGLAARAGYLATTAGWGENRPDEDPRVISRLHVGDRVLGWRCGLADVVYFTAQIKAGHGNYYWSIPLLLGNLLRRLAVAVHGETGKAVP